MRIKAFDNFSFGKMGNKNKKNDSSAGDEQAAEGSDIVEIETENNGKVKGPKIAAVKTKKPVEDTELALPLDVPPVKPHGPAAELTLDVIENGDNAGIKLDEVISDEPVLLGDDVNAKATATKDIKAGTLKVKVEVSTPPAAGASLPVAGAAPPAEEKKEDKSDDSMSLNNLFSQEDEEDNPLDSLINSLPDVSVQELMDDLAEIHRIIKEWRPETKTMI
jgi:hypothetical protein